MNTKIDGMPTAVSHSVSNSGKGAKAEAHASLDGPVNAVSGADSVKLTDTARMLQEVGANLASTSQVDAGRVESVRAALADGSYKVDAEVVASKLMDLEKQLLESK